MKFAHAFQTSPSLVVLMRLEDARIVDVNPRFEAVTGHSRKEATGKTLGELGLWDDVRTQPAIFERLMSNRSISNEPCWFRNRDGEPFAGLLTAELVDTPQGELVFGLIQDIGAYNAREQAIRTAEEKYRSIFENAMEGIYRTTPDGAFVAANPALAQVLGFDSPDDLINDINIQKDLYVDPEERPRLLRMLDEEGQFKDVEFRLKRRNGEIIWVAENARAIKDASGNTLYYEGTLVDITPRKLAEQAMLQSEEKYRALVEHSQDGVFITQHGRYVYVNRTYAEMLGYTQEELTGLEWIRVIAPEDRQMLVELWDQRMRGQWENQAYEIRLLKKDGETRVIASVRAGPVTYNGDIASTGTVRDITEERRNQQALEEAESKFRDLFEHAVLGMYQTAPDGRFIAANQAMAELFGFETPERLIREVKTIRDYYADPAQREILLADLHRTGSVRGLEYRIRRRDGSIAWVSQNARVVRGPDGAVRCYEGVVQDITARKMAEAALHKSEEKYRALVETSQIGVIISAKAATSTSTRPSPR